MADGDIAQVMEIERESFPTMWPQTAYQRELTNKIARYWVITEAGDRMPAEDERPPSGIIGTLLRRRGQEHGRYEDLLGFIGLWLVVGDAHIVTVAVRQSHRRQGIGERLLIAAIETAHTEHQETITLEVRASNEAAQRLYEKYDFQRVGVRKRYYTDNNEDALLLTSPDIIAASFQARFEEMRARHKRGHPDLWP